MRGLGEALLNTYDGPAPEGVPNPFRPMLHAYPTRYHGPIYTRPMYNLPWLTRPYDFAVRAGTEGLGEDAAAAPTGMMSALPPTWKIAVGLTLATAIVVVAVRMIDKQGRRAHA